ncbi:hypothetical protein R3I94_018414 [Phoxinus phoxinus]
MSGRQLSSSDSGSCSMSASRNEFRKDSKRRKRGLQRSHSQHLSRRPHKSSKRVRSMSADEDRERSEPANSSIFQNASTPKLKTSNFSLSEKKFQRKVLQMLIDIRDLVKVAIRKTDVTAFTLKPANSVNELQELESRLQDKNERAALQAYLTRLGGVDDIDMVKKTMSATLSNGVMSLMNLKGKCGKLPFSQTQLFQIICGLV